MDESVSDLTFIDFHQLDIIGCLVKMTIQREGEVK